MSTPRLDHDRLARELNLFDTPTPKHTCPAGRSSIVVEPRIHYTNQGRYRPYRKGKFLGSFYTIDGARDALHQADVRDQYEALKAESERLKKELDTLEVKIAKYETLCGGMLDETK